MNKHKSHIGSGGGNMPCGSIGSFSGAYAALYVYKSGKRKKHIRVNGYGIELIDASEEGHKKA